MGRGRPPPRSGKARRPVIRGHHLPRAHEQPAQRPLRRLPDRPGLRPPPRRRGGAAPRRPAGEPHPARRSPCRRLHADQPPDDLPVVQPAVRDALPRLPVGLLGARDAVPLVDAIEVNTGPQRIGEAPNPFTTTAISFYERRIGPRRARRRARRERLAQRRPHARRRDPVARGRRRDRRVRVGAVRARDPLRREGRPHLREDRRRRRPGAALHRPHPRCPPEGDVRRHRPGPQAEADRPRHAATARCCSSATARSSPRASAGCARPSRSRAATASGCCAASSPRPSAPRSGSGRAAAGA